MEVGGGLTVVQQHKNEAAKEEAERGDDTNLGLTLYTYVHTYIVSYKYLNFI